MALRVGIAIGAVCWCFAAAWAASADEEVAPSAPDSGDVLGGAPLCEASALVRLAGEPPRWLVADNEVHDRLFVFREHGAGLRADPAQPSVELGPDAPRDIEALAIVGDQIVAVGSHSRAGSCAANDKRKRRRIWRGRLRDSGLEKTGSVLGGDAIEVIQRPETMAAECLAALFVTPAPQLALEVCRTLLDAARRATPERCETLNVEGAVGIPAAGGVDRLWLGLRSPLVEGRAVLLRLAEPAPLLRFDAVSLVDLGGLGIRALAHAEGRLFGIAGSTIGAPGSRLWQGQSPSPGARLGSVEVRERLPAGAEGLAISAAGDRAWVVVDGSRDRDDSMRCETPARQLAIELDARPASNIPPTRRLK